MYSKDETVAFYQELSIIQEQFWAEEISQENALKLLQDKGFSTLESMDFLLDVR